MPDKGMIDADEIRAMFRDGRSTGLIAHDLGVSVEQVHEALDQGTAIELPEKPDVQPTPEVPKEDQKPSTSPKKPGSASQSNTANLIFALVSGLILGIIGQQVINAIYATPSVSSAPTAITTPTPTPTRSSDTIEYVIEDKEEYGKVAKSSFVVNKDYWSSVSSEMVYVLEKERVIFDGWDPTVLTFGYPDNYAACAAILGFARQDSPDANFRCRVVYRKYN